MPDRGGRDGRRNDRRPGGGPRGGGPGGGGRGNFRGGRRGGRGGGAGAGNSRPHHHDTDSPMSMDIDSTPTQTPPPAQASGDFKPPLTEAVPLDTPRFADLAGQNLVHPQVIQTITDDLKFDHMMPVQAATLWELLPPNRSDCLVQAKTGTGKTVAFLLPALQTMLSKTQGAAAARRGESTISLLVISPTRELAMQIAAEANSLLQRLPNYKVRIAIGGTNKDREERQILDGCDVLIATPGRLIDHMSNEDILYSLRALDTLVLDEADRLLDMGFMPALREIVGKLPDRKQAPRQGMLFSATIAPHVKQVAGLVLVPNYKFISTIPEGEANTHERVPQHLIKVPTFASVSAGMVGAVRQEAAKEGNFKAIVFAPTAALAGLYGHVLSQIPGLPPVSTLHSRMTQNRRTKITNDYRDAKAAILTATDVIARGMDFPGVTTVFQIGIPSEKQSYIHRLGRTARADAEGRGIFLIAEDESFFPRWTLKEITFVPQEADVSSEPEVARIMERMDEEEKGQIYKAWLGYYNNHMKGLRWDKEELVRQANTYARDALGTPETPTIQRSTVGKMGLRGTKGLNVVPDRPKAPRGRGRGGD